MKEAKTDAPACDGQNKVRIKVKEEKAMINVKSLMPVIALRGVTILPGMIIHFDVSRKKSIKAVETAMMDDQTVFLVTQRDSDLEEPDINDLYSIGTESYIKQVIKLPQNVIRVLVEGKKKAELLSLEMEEPCLQGRIERIETENAEDLPQPVAEAMYRTMKDLFERYSRESGKIGRELASQILDTQNLNELMESISVNLSLTCEKRQHLLEAQTLEEEYEILGALLSGEIQVAVYAKELQKKVKERIDKNQREYMLREQLKVIREELG